ncbi:jg25158 [Pararge aegeria aegeria]|uniref:Jg25158 protein n=1 Tax=Pararge aegeria aegeria TaxID=348720 RepID=A0A8S4RV08_9NEOP|nr:jg25158 [Pararge aegeria aegeria]
MNKHRRRNSGNVSKEMKSWKLGMHSISRQERDPLCGFNTDARITCCLVVMVNQNTVVSCHYSSSSLECHTRRRREYKAERTEVRFCQAAETLIMLSAAVADQAVGSLMLAEVSPCHRVAEM